MQIFILIFTLFILFLIDLPIIYKSNNRAQIITYSILMLIGFSIGVIVIKDLPITSPAIVIENLINFIIMR